MHLFEADVSSKLPLPWFMDTEATRQIADIGMIQTTARIEAGLPSRIGDRSIGKTFATPYSKMGIDMNGIRHRPFSANENPLLRNSPTEAEEEQLEAKGHKRSADNRRHSDDNSCAKYAEEEKGSRHDGQQDLRTRSVHDKELHRTDRSPVGYVNGYKEVFRHGLSNNRRLHEKEVGSARQNRDSYECENGMNKNANNNIHPRSLRDSPSSHNRARTGVGRKNAASFASDMNDAKKYSQTTEVASGGGKHAEYYNYAATLQDENDGERLNGSDILKRMYASFGPNQKPSDKHYPLNQSSKPLPHSTFRKRKYSSSEYHDSWNGVVERKADGSPQKIIANHAVPMQDDHSHSDEEEILKKRRKTRKSSDCKGEAEDATSYARKGQASNGQEKGTPGCNDMKIHGQGSKGGQTIFPIRQPNDSNKEVVVSARSISPLRKPSPDSHNSAKVTSPRHSIDALLSKTSAETEKQFSGDDRRRVCTQDRHTSPQPASPRSRASRNTHHTPDKRDNPAIDQARDEQMARAKYTDENRRVRERATPREAKTLIRDSDDAREAYNDKSREIFLREKELIETSLRQNALPFGLPTDPSAFQNPYLLDPNGLSAFQSGLLANNAAHAMHDQALMLKSASMAAATANPLALGLGQYFANPYLLRGLMGNNFPGTPYSHAIAHGLLSQPQSIMPFLNALPAANSMYPGASSLYGPMSMQDADPMAAAAIAASLRQNAAATYHAAAAGYPFLQNQLAQQVHQAQLEEVKRESLASLTNNPSLEDRHHSKVPLGAKGMDPELRTAKMAAHVDPDPNTDIGKRKPDAYTSLPATSRIRLHDVEKKKSKDLSNKLPHHHLYHRKDSNRTTGDFQANDEKPTYSTSKPEPFSPHSQKLKRKPLPTVQDRPAPKRRSLSPGRSDVKYSSPSDRLISSNLLRKTLEKDTEDTLKQDTPLINKNHSTAEKTPRQSSYKNLTRERRLVANARERTRVHTISSAFEELRQQIPSYSCNQKLSKLAILRIACSYIQSLSVLAGRNTEDTFTDSVDQCTRVLQAESRARSRRKSNKAQIEWEVANYEKAPGFGSDVHGKGDGSRQSLEEGSSVGRSSIQKSPTRETYPQVREEIPHCKAAELSDVDSRLLGESHGFEAAACTDPNLANERFRDEVFTETRQSTVVDSLDVDDPCVKRLHVNDTKDVKSGMNHAPKATGESNIVDSTWRASVSPKDAVQGAKAAHTIEHDRAEQIHCQTGKPELSGCAIKEEIGDDQQAEVINVED